MLFDGIALRYYRRRAGLTQAELGSKAGCEGNEIWRYEQGKVVPKMDRIEAIARVLKVTVDDLTKKPVEHVRAVSGDVSGLSPREQGIIKEFLDLSPLRQAKLLGYMEGLLASVAGLTGDNSRK